MFFGYNVNSKRLRDINTSKEVRTSRCARPQPNGYFFFFAPKSNLCSSPPPPILHGRREERSGVVFDHDHGFRFPFFARSSSRARIGGESPWPPPSAAAASDRRQEATPPPRKAGQLSLPLSLPLPFLLFFS